MSSNARRIFLYKIMSKGLYCLLVKRLKTKPGMPHSKNEVSLNVLQTKTVLPPQTPIGQRCVVEIESTDHFV